MKAIQIQEFGKPEVLLYQDIEIPQISANEVCRNQTNPGKSGFVDDLSIINIFDLILTKI